MLKRRQTPLWRLVDLRKAVAFAKEWDLVSMIDNTFASPILQKPIDLGFDLVLHSATKFLAGHSDVVAGAAVGRAGLIQKVRSRIIQLGGSMDPEAAFLLIRGMKTLGIRMKEQSRTAMAVAKYLAAHPKVKKVHFPGLTSHPDHALAKRQMSGFGGNDGLRPERRVARQRDGFAIA